MQVGPAGSRAQLVSFWLMVALVLAYLIGLAVPPYGPDLIVDVVLSLAAEAAAVAVFWVVLAVSQTRRHEVLLVAIGLSFSLLADVYYAVTADFGYLPSPSPGDIGYYLFYPFLFAALVVTVRRQKPGMRWIGWTTALDAAVCALGSGALLSFLLVPSLSGVPADEMTDAVIAATYPGLDLLLVAIVGAVAASPEFNLGRRSAVFICALIFFAAGDVAYIMLGQAGLYYAGHPIDALWVIGMALFGSWAAALSSTGDIRGRSGDTAVPLLAGSVLVALAVLVTATQTHVSLLAIVLAALTLGVAAAPVMVRHVDARRVLAQQQALVRQLEELDRAKSEMMATVNHEIRTPLTSIRGYIDLVVGGDGGALPPKAHEMLSVAQHNAERLAVLVDDVLTMSRIDAGSAKPEREPVDLRPLLYRVVASLQPFAASRKVDLDIDEDDIIAIVTGDEGQLERAFTNITQNALKFTPAGGSVGIELERDETTIVVRIIDTGMGIPERDLPFLFGRFYRASNAEKGAVPGTGLGLAIVRSLVRAHHGDISIASTLGVGTTARVTLPATPDD